MAKKKSAQQKALDYVTLYADKHHPATGRVRKDTGTELAIRPGSHAQNIGLEIPFLMEYVIDCQVWPLGTFIEINGPSESHKTMLLYEIGRWFAEAGGWLDMTVTESKISRSLARSIIGWSAERRKQLVAETVGSLDDGQSNVLRGIDAVIDMYEGRGPQPQSGEKLEGAVFPVVFGLDSLNGATMKEKAAKIEKDGFAGRNYAIEAGSLTEYLKMISGKIRSYPISLVGIRHLKQDEYDPSDPYKYRKKSKPGGKHVKFQATVELETSVGKRTQTQDTHPLGGMLVEHCPMTISNMKNSGGTNFRKIDVRISWRRREIGGEMLQFTQFHWDESLVNFLMNFHKKGHDRVAKGSKSTSPMKHLDYFFHIRRDDRSKKYWSETFGMTKDDAVSKSQMGRMIQNNPDAVASLRAAFSVQTGLVWQVGEDFRKLYAKEMKESSERLDKQFRGAEEDIKKFLAEIADEEFD